MDATLFLLNASAYIVLRTGVLSFVCGYFLRLGPSPVQPHPSDGANLPPLYTSQGPDSERRLEY